MSGLFDGLSADARKKLRKKAQPGWTGPMLAVLSHEVFSDPGWIFERKLDGERCLVFRKGNSVRLLSRNRKELNDSYPELEAALRDQDRTDFVADGEVVAFAGNRTSFERLQARMQVKDRAEAEASGVAVYLYLFDLLHADGHDLTGLGQRDRKALLKRALEFGNRIRYTAHRNEHGKRYHREACGKHWEGLIAKEADAAYVHGRSRRWLKLKCVHRQEFVIGGWTDPQGSRTGFGALLVGYHEDGDLRYAGKVGTGYDEETLERLRKRMDGLARESPPFAGDGLPREHVHWITPRLVGEVGFTEWTADGKLRHPRFLGLRRDKDADQVVREDG